MDVRRSTSRNSFFEQLEQRWLLSTSVASGSDLLAPQTQLVDAKTITSMVATALANAPAGDPIYMKYGDITGDVTDPGFVGDIQLNSFQWGVGRGISSPSGGSGDREASAPSVSEIVVTKHFDVSSVPLIQEAFIGTGTDVEIDFVKPTQDKPQIYLKLDLSNVLISGYSMNSGGDTPSESLSLNFTKIRIDAIDAAGGDQSFTYDLAKAQASLFAPAAASATDGASSAASIASAPDAAGDPIYMKYGNISGDVTDPGYVGDTQLNSFQWGVGRGISSPTGGSADREASAPSVSEIVVTKTFDSSSVPLIAEAFGGTPSHVETDFANTANNAKLQTYLKVQVDNTLLSGYSMSSGGDTPNEALSLNFTKIRFDSVGPKGEAQSFSWDLAKPGVAAPAVVSAAAAPVAPATVQAPAVGAPADGDPIYMQYGDIKGDVTDKGFKDMTTQATSFQWGVGRGISSPTGGSADREASAPSVSEIVVSKNFDSSSVPLIQEAFVGTSKPVDIDFVAANGKKQGQIYLKLHLDNTLVSSYSMSSGGDNPSESLSLNFTKIQFDVPVGKGSDQVFSYDLTSQPKLAPVIAAAASITSQPSSASPDSSGSGDPIFMKYGAITGDVTTKGYEGSTQLNSFQWGVGRGISTPTGAGGTRQITPPSVSEVTVSKSFDSSSIPLMQEALGGTGAHVETDFANAIKGPLQTYLTVTLDNTLISGYSMSSGGDRPSESLSLNFTKIQFEYNPPKGKDQIFVFDLTKIPIVAPAVAAPGALATAPLTAASSPTAAGDPIYMKYGDIEGSVATKGYEGSIEINSFQWGIGRGISSPSGPDGRQVGPVSISEIVVTKNFDAASVPLIQEAFIGGAVHVETDFVDLTPNGAQPYLKVTLDNNLISGFSMSSGGDRPTESISLNFTKIRLDAIGPNGAEQSVSFDLQKQAATLVPAASSPAALAAVQSSGSAGAGAADAAAAAAGDDPIYMKYGDIKGETTAKGEEGAIEVNSFSWGVGRGISSPTGGSADREASAPSVSEVVVTKPFDSTSIPLIQQTFGDDAANVILDFSDINSDGAAVPYLRIDLGNTLISGYSTSSGGDNPSESLSLNFTKISFTSFFGGQDQTFSYDLTKAV